MKMLTYSAALALLGASLLIPYVSAQAAPAAPAKPRMTLTSGGFDDAGIIPAKFSQASPTGAVSPKLTWANVPDGVVSFALFTTDPDGAPQRSSAPVIHWMIFNLPAASRELPEAVPSTAKLPDGSIQGINTGGKVGYMGMGAPAPGPYHHYTFTLYALDTSLTLGPEATAAEVLSAMDKHVLMKAVTVGLFHRP